MTYMVNAGTVRYNPLAQYNIESDFIWLIASRRPNNHIFLRSKSTAQDG